MNGNARRAVSLGMVMRDVRPARRPLPGAVAAVDVRPAGDGLAMTVSMDPRARDLLAVVEGNPLEGPEPDGPKGIMPRYELVETDKLPDVELVVLTLTFTPMPEPDGTGIGSLILEYGTPFWLADEARAGVSKALGALIAAARDMTA